MWVTAVALLSYVTDTKPVADGREPAHGFAASAVLHATGRKSEGTPLPLLHLHCHLLGVMDTRDMLRCPHSHVLDEVDAVLECGAYGRAVLAEELRNLGFQLKACTGYEGRYFEIAGVPQGLLRPEISARTECGGPVQEAQYGWVVGPEHTDGPTVRVRLLGLGQSCWRCKRATIALVGLLPVRSSNVDNMLACMDERVLSLAAGALPENVRQSRQVGRIAARYSKTEGRRYLSNGCFHCDALLGRFPLFANELRKCIEKYGLSGLTEIIQADVRYKSIRWQLVRANTWAGAVNELSPGAYLFDGQLDDDTAGGSWEFDLREWEP